MWPVEDDKPTINKLKKFVPKKYASNWKDIGLKLGVKHDDLDSIKENSQQDFPCFQKTLNNWLKLHYNVTWRTLEVALTNVNRHNLGLGPVDDVYDGTFIPLIMISVKILLYFV